MTQSSTITLEVIAAATPDVFLNARCVAPAAAGGCPNPPVVGINTRFYCPAHVDHGFELALEPVRAALARSEFDYLVDPTP